MQLHIKREEQRRGLIFKKTVYLVHSQLLVSEEERAAMKTLDLDDLRIVDAYECDGLPQGNRKVGYWTDKGNVFLCANIPEAQRVEQEIKEAATHIKDVVTQFIEDGAVTEGEAIIDL